MFSPTMTSSQPQRNMKNLLFNIRPCPDAGEMIQCNNVENISELKCAPESLKQLMKFYILKDGCQTGMFGKLRQQRSLSMDKESYWFTRTNTFGGQSNIIFGTPLLKSGLELIAEKTPFVSGDQLEIINQMIKNDIRLNQSQSIKSRLRNSSLFKKTLYILLAQNIISKIQNDSRIRILNKIYSDYYYNFKEIYFHGQQRKIIWINNMKILDLFFALYNYICSDIYQTISLIIPEETDLNIFISGNMGFNHNLFSSYENVLSLFEKLGFIQFTATGGSKKLSDETVDQLRSLMKKHGKKCSKDGKRLTKDQMIRILKRC